MYKRFHDRFGTAGVVIGVIALIAALGGSALAAGGLTKQQEKQVTKIAKKYAGKAGAPGAPGTNGTNGTDGAAGTNGVDGTDGEDGEDGEDGASVTGVPATVGECADGGVKYTSASGDNAVCNGAEGSPWTDGGTLPANATETGAWRFSSGESAKLLGTFFFKEISFPIPLSAELDENHVWVLFAANTSAEGTADRTSGSNVVTNLSTTAGKWSLGAPFVSASAFPAGTTITACSPDCSAPTSLTLSANATSTATGGTVRARVPTDCENGANATAASATNPEADPGFLCVYGSGLAEGTAAKSIEVVNMSNAPGASPFGAFLRQSAEPFYVLGSWAVTGAP